MPAVIAAPTATLLAVAAFAIVRLIAIRATFGLSTLLPFLVYGFLAGPYAAAGFQRLMSAYGWTGADGWHGVVAPLVVGAGTLVVLLLPVAAALRASLASRSVADAFLVAWCCGFGFDFHAQLATALSSPEPLR